MNRAQWLRLAPLILMLLVVLLIGTGVFTKDKSESEKRMTQHLVGYEIPLFSLPFIGRDNTSYQFSPQILRGNVVLINIFSSWCQPCKYEHPVLMKLAQTGKVNMVGLAWKDNADDIIKYLNANGNPFQLVGHDEVGATTVDLGLTGVPETIIIDKDGVVVYNTKEVLTDEIVNEEILPLVARLDPDLAVRTAAPVPPSVPAAPTELPAIPAAQLRQQPVDVPQPTPYFPPQVQAPQPAEAVPATSQPAE